MIKYWNPERIRKIKEKQELREQKAYDAAKEARRRGPTLGTDPQKNAELILDVMGSSVNRAMVLRLKKEGAMSLSKLAKPFGMSLPAALKHLNALEGAAFAKTHKRGRVRICIYNPKAFNDLKAWLASHT